MNKKKKTYEPLLFPTHDESWLKFNNLDLRTKNFWRYRNEDGEIMFVIYRLDVTNKEGGPNKQFFPICYGKDVETQTIEYCNQQLWKKDRPLLNIHALTMSEYDKVLITEGEKACYGFRDKLQYLHGDNNSLAPIFASWKE